MPPPDIFKRGVDRDTALRFATQATQPPSQFAINTLVDESSLALRAARAGEDGSTLIAPGTDWPNKFFDTTTIISSNSASGTINSPDINTRGWGLALVSVSYASAVGTGNPSYINIYSLTVGDTYQIVWARPIDKTGRRQDFVVPLNADTHFIQFVAGLNTPAGSLQITVRRLPPSLYLTSAHPPSILLVEAITVTAFAILFQYLDRLAPRLRVEYQIIDVSGTNAIFSIVVTTLNGLTYTIQRSPSATAGNNASGMITVDASGGAQARLAVSGTSPTATLDLAISG